MCGVARLHVRLRELVDRIVLLANVSIPNNWPKRSILATCEKGRTLCNAAPSSVLKFLPSVSGPPPPSICHFSPIDGIEPDVRKL